MVRIQQICISGIFAQYAKQTNAATAAWSKWGQEFNDGMMAIDERPTDLECYSAATGSGTVVTHATTVPPNNYQIERVVTTRSPSDWNM